MAADSEAEVLAPTKSTTIQVIGIAATLTLGNLAICTHRSSRVYMYQQSQCLQYYLAHDPSKVNAAWGVEESICKLPEVQSPLSMIEGLDAFIQLLPAVLVLATFSKLLPKVGLRRLLILNLAFIVCEVTSAAFFFSLHRSWTIVAILLTPLCDLLGGGDLTRFTLGATIISQLLPPEKLTNANNYISSVFILASVTGSAIGSLLLSHHIYYLNMIGVICALLAIGVALTLMPPDLGREKTYERPATEAEVGLLDDDTGSDIESILGPHSSKEITQSIPQILLGSWKSSIVTLATLFQVPNPTFTTLWIFFLYAFCTIVEILSPQYISLSLHWSLASVNALIAGKTLICAAVLIALPTFRRVLLEPRLDSQTIDILIIQVSMAMNLTGMVGYGFPLPAPLLSTALCFYTAGNGVSDALITYGRSTLPAGMNPADFFVKGGLIQLIAGLIGSFFWTALFSLCLKSDFLPIGFPFWICAALFLVNLGLVQSLKGQAVYKSIALD